jgi:hypothetical protein
MKAFVKLNLSILDPYSLFVATEAHGLVIPGTTNMFAKKHKEKK